MKCNNCGSELYDGAKYCGECGAKVPVEEAGATDDVKQPHLRRQTAPRYLSDQSVTGSLSGQAGLQVVDEAKKNGPIAFAVNEDGTASAESGRSPRKQRADQKKAQRQQDEAARMQSEESSVERSSGKAKSEPAQTNESGDIAFKSTSGTAEKLAAAGAAAVAATEAAKANRQATQADAPTEAMDAAKTPQDAEPPAASKASGTTDASINVASGDWDDSLTTIIDPLQTDAVAASDAAASAKAAASSASATGAMKPVVERPDPVSGSYEAQQKKKSRKGIAAALIALALLGGVGGAWYANQQAASDAQTQAIIEENEAKSQQAKDEAEAAQQQQQEDAQKNTTHNVRLAVSGINYDETGTRIPVQLIGATADGQSVNQVQFVGSDGKGITVPSGTYTATVLASPIASSGMLYTVPTEPMDFTLTDDMLEDVSTGQAIVLMPIEAADVTSDMVDYAYSLAVQDTANLAKVENCKAAADKVVADNNKKSEEEAAKAEKERMRQARPQLAQEFVSNYFTNVIFTNSNDDSEVLLIDNWTDVVLPYAKEGSGLANSLMGEKSGDFYAARNVTVSSQDDTSVTLAAEVASTDQISSGWTAQGWNATVKCTFDDDNYITAMEITTPNGTTKY